ncbi:hypothetical protein A2154_00730 [Candidatus Gottesmanbacteria bacterium RBG_16_43_7]|uniref:Uncharacterized protein n=1 Tax=Candidatus Gottesmanbacteria bacterium RBG_16_43_7 TaxID=1798373 RepID=A0A1F5Z862_9BACT|nr:MAG: hypothetical protein A2154_00730 [Candidatus Gottesmanbacteria bacterium RBG_16_43_7]
MKKHHKYFPHITRQMPARFISICFIPLLCYIFILSIFATSVVLLQRQTLPFWTTYINYPDMITRPERMIVMARRYMLAGNMEKARNELNLAMQTERKAALKTNQQVPGPSVLGTSSADQILALWNSSQNQHQANRAFWESTVEKNPDYLYGYIALALYAFQDGNIIQSHNLLAGAQRLIPDHPLVRQMAALLEQ